MSSTNTRTNTRRPATPAAPAPQPQPQPATPAADLPAGLVRAAQAAAGVPQPAPQPATLPVLSSREAADPRAGSKAKAVLVGFPIIPARNGAGFLHVKPATAAERGYVLALRKRAAGKGVGDVRWFAIRPATADLPTLPARTIGSRFETWHSSNRADCGAWEVVGTDKLNGSDKPVPVNILGPVAASAVLVRPAAS